MTKLSKDDKETIPKEAALKVEPVHGPSPHPFKFPFQIFDVSGGEPLETATELYPNSRHPYCFENEYFTGNVLFKVSDLEHTHIPMQCIYIRLLFRMPSLVYLQLGGCSCCILASWFSANTTCLLQHWLQSPSLIYLINWEITILHVTVWHCSYFILFDFTTCFLFYCFIANFRSKRIHQIPTLVHILTANNGYLRSRCRGNWRKKSTENSMLEW